MAESIRGFMSSQGIVKVLQNRGWALATIAPLALFGASAALFAVLAWQAFTATTDHRALAQRVLRDYADLAAIELTRRVTHVIGNYGFAVAARALEETASRDGHRLPEHQQLLAAMPKESQSALELVGPIVRFSLDGAHFARAGGEVSDAIRESLIRESADVGQTLTDYRVGGATIDGVLHPVIFTARDASIEGRSYRMGFLVRMDSLAVWLREFGLQEPLLPPSLASRADAQSSIHVIVRSPDGRVLLQSSAEPVTSAIRVTRELTGTGNANGLRGYTVQVAIADAAAERLVIGGLPPSRTGMLLGLLGLALAMAVASVMQILRERRIAEMRQDFVTRASHELRTPVARIRMFTETLLLNRARNAGELQDALQSIDRASRRLSFLIENILQFSRQRSVPSGLDLQPVDITSLVREVANDVEARIQLHAPENLIAMIDREAVRRVLLNLLDNAVKYGGSDPSIDITLESRGAEVLLSVSDAGAGIPAHERERIWLPYVRLPRDRRSAVAGTGIGLAVVSDLIRAHGGRRWVEESPTGGSKFVVTFQTASQEAT
jgi:signal transduction histidine kinase